MNAGTAIIIVAGIGGAVFLYMRSQAAQAAALAAANAAPGAGLIQKTENTLKAVVSPTTWHAISSLPRPAEHAAASVAGGVVGVVHGIASYL